MNSEKDQPINLAVHESTDPELLKKDAESKTGITPNPEGSNNQLNSSEPDLLRQHSNSGIVSNPEDFNHEYEEDRETPPQVGLERSPEDQLANNQIMITNLQGG